MAKKDTAALNNPAQIVAESIPEPPTASVDAASPQKNTAKAGGPPSGFYMYIGPTLRGLIRSGTIYRGDKACALAQAQKAIEKQPLVKTLIVSGDYLPEARLKVKTPGNALYANYRKIAGR